jgi:steroid delta-isomerase-like uncharacterized protein
MEKKFKSKIIIMKTEKEIATTKVNGANTSAEENRNLVRKAVEEIWNKGNYDNIEEFVSPDFVVHSATPGMDIRGPEGAKQYFTQLREAFPDIHFTIVEQIAEGDRVVTHWKAKGTHKGDFNGIPPTGRQFSITAIDIDRIVNGKVTECWSNMDELGLLRQLGAVPG